jgi:DNA polymerase I-like protein with 3'-5' exonuclease and polymerase domains
MQDKELTVLAIDFETYYDAEYSLSEMDPWNYVHDKRFDCYLMAISTSDGFRWVGNPKDFTEWGRIKGSLLVAHNAAFDNLVLARLRELGVCPEDCIPEKVRCTCDMAAYLSAPRNLKGAVKELLGRERSKAMRTAMKGRNYKDAVSAGREEELIQYGGDDADDCLELWMKFSDQWPECEQEYSNGLREDHLAGIPVSRERIEASYISLKQQLHDVKSLIPWADEKKILSYPTFRAYCRQNGLNCPASIAKTSEAGNAFIDKHAEDFPWVKGFRDYRSLNAHFKKIETIRNSLRPDDTMYLQIKYFGTHTGRTAAGSNDEESGDKFNPLNQPRKALFGVDLRRQFVAPKGFVFGCVDYSQIEAIMLAWRVNDLPLLDLVRKEGNLYQAYARKWGWFDGEDIKDGNHDALYQRAKVTVLGAGYSAGWKTFQNVAKVQYNLDLTDEESQKLIYGYRNDNPLVVQFWQGHQLAAALSCNARDKTHEVVLKSGRVQMYFDPQWVVRPGRNGKPERSMAARTFMGGPLKKIYGGLLTENEIQATARDVLRDARNAVRKAGYHTIFDVYDEIVFLFPESEAEDMMADASRIMVSSSPWAEGCPLGVDGHLTHEYRKF